MSKRKKDKEKKRIRGAAARNRAEKHSSGFSTAIAVPEGTERFKEKAGKPYRLDIIPFTLKESNAYADKGEVYFEVTIWVHYGIGANQSPYICPAKQVGEKCPICEYRTKLSKDPDADEQLLKDLAPKQRQLFRIIDTKDKDKGIQLWEISFHNFGKQLDARIRNSDEDDRYNEFYELEDGFTLRIGFADTSFGGGKPFPKAESIDFKSRAEDYDEDTLDEGPDLDECIKILEYDELKQIHLQTSDEEEGEEEKKDNSKKEEKEENKNDPDWKKGDRVIVEIDDEDYAGKIKSVDEDDDTATVKFDDGDVQEVDFDDIQKEVDSKEDEDEKSIKKNSKEKNEKKGGKNKCPGGGIFGKDTDELSECNDCSKWDKCDDA